MPAPDGSPLTLWLTDRSRYALGTGQCARKRYLTNHAGPTGYGFVHASDSLPLATGKYAHLALEQLWQHLLTSDTLPPTIVVRSAIQTACDAYLAQVSAKGFRGMLASERTEDVIREQQTLIEGLIWCTVRTIFPWLHEHYRILQVETESIYILDCTCGLSPTDSASNHDSRGCHGIAQMLKQDLIAEKRHGSGLAYFETKTTGWAGDSWAPQWEVRPQLGVGTLGIPERYGKEVTETWILALYKGARKTYEDPFQGSILRQDSPLCYGYCRPANPPLTPDDWLPSYQWQTEDGTTKRASKAHQKRGLWEMEQSDFPAWLDAKDADPSITPGEFWVDFLPESVRQKQVFLVGPMNRQDKQIEILKRQVVGEERRWQDILWKLYTLQSEGHPWASDEFQAQLDYLVPASWECRRFGLRHQCEFLPICLQQQGWEDPLSAGFVPRRPHHAPELEQAISRGLLPEQAEGVEEDE